MANLGRIRLLDFCPICEAVIKEKLSKSHFLTLKAICTVYTNNEIASFCQSYFYLQDIYDLEKARYVLSIENEFGTIKVRPNGKFEINDNLDGYCFDSFHKFQK